MKKLTQISLLLLAAMVAFAGCEQAKEAADDAANKAKDMANVDFGDFDVEGLKAKFSGITDGLADVTSENVDGLASKITDLTGAMDGLGIDKLPGPAKGVVTALMSGFGDKVKSALDGITEDGLLSKLKPVIEALMEKIKAFM